MTKAPEEQIRSYFEQKNHEFLALREEARRLIFPEQLDVEALIQDRIEEVTDLIPDKLEQKPFILKFLRCALKDYKRGNDDGFRINYLRADKNIDNALSDQWTLGVTKQFGRNAERSAQVKRELREPAWQLWQATADEIVSKMLSANPARTPSKREIAKKIEQRLKSEGSEHAASFETIKKHIVIRG